jgi:hypothetical protein
VSTSGDWDRAWEMVVVHRKWNPIEKQRRPRQDISGVMGTSFIHPVNGSSVNSSDIRRFDETLTGKGREVEQEWMPCLTFQLARSP